MVGVGSGFNFASAHFCSEQLATIKRRMIHEKNPTHRTKEAPYSEWKWNYKVPHSEQHTDSETVIEMLSKIRSSLWSWNL